MNIKRTIAHVKELDENIKSLIREYEDDYQVFLSNQKYHDLVLLYVQQIGEEIGKNIPIDYLEEYPDIPWNEIRGLRNRLVHDYFNVDYEILWETIHRSLPELIYGLEIIEKRIDQEDF